MPRTANGQEVKLMIVISTEANDKINEYAKIKGRRKSMKVSKIEAASEVMMFGIDNIDPVIERMEKEIEDFKNN